MRRLNSESLSPECTNYQNEYAFLQSELSILNYYFLLQKAFKVGIPDQAFFCAFDEVEQQILQLMQKLERHIFVTVTELYEPSVQDGDVFIEDVAEGSIILPGNVAYTQLYSELNNLLRSLRSQLPPQTEDVFPPDVSVEDGEQALKHVELLDSVSRDFYRTTQDVAALFELSLDQLAESHSIFDEILQYLEETKLFIQNHLDEIEDSEQVLTHLETLKEAVEQYLAIVVRYEEFTKQLYGDSVDDDQDGSDDQDEDSDLQPI